jgi:hypothetical protein
MGVNTFLALSIVFLFISLLGFIGAYSESKPLLEAYSFIMGFAIILTIVYSGVLVHYTNVFKSYYSLNWGDLMLYAH